ncbi:MULTISPECIES: hypothetical protein [Priestia]|uniref:hypothetical protein n=1 Tax=Priestia TaxID=2800373 RepID=UPI000BFE64D3|nr:hypothetical protein [Priestia aryabhattai]PHF65989.1 hypothetical protein COI42_23165 [Priestia aryabhattai]
MIEQLRSMDEGLKTFICKKIFEERIGLKNEIVYEGIVSGFDEQDILNGLNIFLYNELITIPIRPHLVSNNDIFINDSKFNELKFNGDL